MVVHSELRIEAGAGIARVVLEETFENPYEETLRVTYKMPLPVDGAVSGYAFCIGSRTVTGKVDRKESARARFEEASSVALRHCSRRTRRTSSRRRLATSLRSRRSSRKSRSTSDSHGDPRANGSFTFLQNFGRARKLFAECLKKHGIHIDEGLGA